jgi:thiamine biosynthesis lipoprotein
MAMTTVQPFGNPNVTQSRLRIALGTFVAIEAEAPHETVARAGIEAAFAAIMTVQDLMHPIRGRDLAAMVESRPGTALRLHRWTYEVLELCVRLNRVSEGIFDPCLAQAEGRISDLKLLPTDTVIAGKPLRIDLGGIAKGYAVDRALDALRAAGCIAGLVNAGGDLAVFGARSHRIVCNSSPMSVIVELRDAALASSDARSLEAARPREHRGYYDASGRCTSISGAVSVIAPRAALADGLTKCLLAARREAKAALLAAFGAKQVRCPPALLLPQEV